MWKTRAMPGWWIDYGESIPDVVARESEEELWIIAVFDKIIFIQDYLWERKESKTHFTEFFCTVKNNNDFSNAIEMTKEASHWHELSDIWWFDISEFPQEFLPTALIDVLKQYITNKDKFQTQYISDITKRQ